jgi:hypothetical protein
MQPTRSCAVEPDVVIPRLHRQHGSYAEDSAIGDRDYREARPVAPSRSSRAASRWPAWHAVSSTMCRATQRRSVMGSCGHSSPCWPGRAACRSRDWGFFRRLGLSAVLLDHSGAGVFGGERCIGIVGRVVNAVIQVTCGSVPKDDPLEPHGFGAGQVSESAQCASSRTEAPECS